MTDRKRNYNIDLGKCICMIMIIITHFEWSQRERLSYLFPFYIDMAVPLLMLFAEKCVHFPMMINEENKYIIA